MEVLGDIISSMPVGMAAMVVLGLIVVWVLLIVAPIATMFYARKINERIAEIQDNVASLARANKNK